MIVDSAFYRDGIRGPDPEGLDALAVAARAGEGIAWIGLCRPTEAEFAEVADAFGLHGLAVEDAVHAHQRPKLERYGDTLFCVLRPARYIDDSETVEFGELHVFAGPGFVITARQDDACDLGGVRAGLEARPDLLGRGPVAILHAIMDRVVDDYAPVVAGLENDIDEIEDKVFGGEPQRLAPDLRAVAGGDRLPARVEAPGADARPARGRPRHRRRGARGTCATCRTTRCACWSRSTASGSCCRTSWNVNLTLETKALSEASDAQNDQVKKISAWAAILFAPTLIGTVYGMNFDHMPELHWRARLPARRDDDGRDVGHAVPDLQAARLDLKLRLPGRPRASGTPDGARARARAPA